MIPNNSSIKPLRVLMMPDYRIINPYQELLSKSLEPQGANVIFPFGYRRIFPIFRAIKNSKHIDILHLHWLTPYLKGENILIKLVYGIKLLIDIMLVKSANVKIVWTIHNHVSHDSQFPRLEKNIQKIIFKVADKIIFHSFSALSEFSEIYHINEQKAAVIPIGNYRNIYSELIDPLSARQALGIPQSGHVYLNLGMLRPYKGIEKLLKIWGENKEFHQGCTLLIAGKPLDEVYGSKLTEQANSIEGVFIHPYFIEDSEIHLFFSAADVVVLPFEKILTSASIILAMSYNKPIIAPRTKSIAETLGTADWLLYEDKDDQGLLKALKKSTEIDLSNLSDLVKHECDKFNWDDMGLKTYHVYDAVLKNSQN
ncbi:glycosyltransferase family 4 protein [Sphaerospermopsis aphanizomenoides BCCUSP55]|uniref:glycosyltransferase family 4 protein n=1 Tax=Sphaerospermopsis aphanizomenoides TaxID=459663 RepID=UPI001905E594|nr:glycosyltransferase family 4 protein [Sphaerospermopsis aphanizomenoides]MBK1987108.1 glycosyltransferase family 4 protein [Sphaerospermopsis aphanizomenoides BCCUSP55]